MAVEILILSGARRGERLELGSNEFRLGDGRDHEVRFDSAKDPGAKDRSLILRLEQDGWHIRNEGSGPIWINQNALQNSAPLRSSDVIRLSESGPDVSFVIHARGVQAVLPESAATAAGPVQQPVVDRLNYLPPPQLSISPTRRPVVWLPIAASVVVGLVLLAITLHLYQPAATGPARATDTLESGVPQNSLPVRSEGKLERGPEIKQAQAPLDIHPVQPDAQSDSKPVSEKKTPQEPEPGHWPDAVGKVRRAVFSLAVESPGGLMWSFGTCFAIRNNTVVTSASLATEIAKLRAQDKGWKAWVLSPEQSVRLEVKNEQVHIGYVDAIAANRPPQFFDVALLTVDGPLPETCELANQAELERLGRQTRIACVGVAQSLPQQGDRPDPIGRFDLLESESYTGRLLDIGQLPGGSRAPRLLFLPNSFPATLWGSPIFTEDGKVIAVFTMVERRDGDSSVAVLVAPVLDSVADWLREPVPQMWVAPKVTAGPAAVEKVDD